VSSVITSALCLVKKQLEEKSIELVTRISSALPRAAISAGQLQEVILNLVINAIQAIRGPGVIRVDADRAGAAAVRVRVTDSGEGIRPENLRRIFDPFFTTKGPLGGGEEQGTGLGLAVCYNIVQARGGRIEVESDVGAGASFSVTIPLSDGSAASMAEMPAASAQAAGGEAPRPLRLLVVDDEEHMRKLLAEFLAGHEVVCCSRGEEAVAEYDKKPFDYVILDICMSHSITGGVTLERLKALDPSARVIVSSGRLLDGMNPEVLAQAHGHLLKPYKLEDLAALLRGGDPDTSARSAEPATLKACGW
jgi:CheY-like chemotaxis protein